MESVSLIVFIVCASALVLLGVCYGAVWLRIYFETRRIFNQDYLSRKEQSRRGPKVTKPDTETKAVNKDRIY